MTTSADRVRSGVRPTGRPSRRHLLAGAAGAGLAVATGVRQGARAADLPPLGTYDVVVIGSGAAGMTAALAAAKRGLSCVVVEKAATFGGSAARSGAGIWVPNNPVILAAGVPDTPAKAAAYLAAVVGADVPVDRQRAFLAHGPAMISFVLANSPLRFRWMEGYSDYYPELPGGLPNGRSVEPDQLDGNLLGAELARLNPPYLEVPAGMVVFSADYKWLALTAVSAKGIAVAAECLARGTKAAALGQKPLTMGQSLAAGLRLGLRAMRRAGLARHPAHRAVRRGREGDRRRGHQGRHPRARPRPARGRRRLRRVRAQRGDAGAVPATADRHRVDRRREGEHRGRNPGRAAAGCRPRPDGRRLVGARHSHPRPAVLLPRRTHPPRRAAGQRHAAAGSSTRPPPTATSSTPCTSGTRPTPTSRPG